jgi:hypothetical protein
MFLKARHNNPFPAEAIELLSILVLLMDVVVSIACSITSSKLKKWKKRKVSS